MLWFLCCSLCVTCSRDKPSIRDLPRLFQVLVLCYVESKHFLGPFIHREWLYRLFLAVVLALLWHP